MKKLLITTLVTMSLVVGPLVASAQSADLVDANLSYLVLEARAATTSPAATSTIVAPPLATTTTPARSAPPPLFTPPASSFLIPLAAPVATSSATTTLPVATSSATSSEATSTPRAPSTTPLVLLPATREPTATSTKVLGITLPSFMFGPPSSNIYRTNHLSTAETEYLLALAAALGIVGMVFVGSNALNRLIVRRPRYESPRFRA